MHLKMRIEQMLIKDSPGYSGQRDYYIGFTLSIHMAHQRNLESIIFSEQKKGTCGTEHGCGIVIDSNILFFLTTSNGNEEAGNLRPQWD